MRKGFNVPGYFTEVYGDPIKEERFLAAYRELTKDWKERPVLMFPGGTKQSQETSLAYCKDPFMANPYAYAEEFAQLCLRTGSDAAIGFTLDYELFKRMGVKAPTEQGAMLAETVDWRYNNMRLLKTLLDAGVRVRFIRMGNESYMNQLLVGTKIRMGRTYNPNWLLGLVVNNLNRGRKNARQLFIELAEEYCKLVKEYKTLIREISDVKIAAILAEEETAAYKDWNEVVKRELHNPSGVDYFAFQFYLNGDFKSYQDVQKVLVDKLGSNTLLPKIATEYNWQYGTTGEAEIRNPSRLVYEDSIEDLYNYMGFHYAIKWRLVGERLKGGGQNSYNQITV